MNPKKGRTLEEKTGFGPAELRRMIPFLPTDEDVPDALRLQGDAIIEAARKAGPLAMPTPTPVTVRAEDVAAVLRPNLTPGGLALVDFELVAMLCEAMAAFAPAGYVEYVVRDLLAVYETAEWADPSWRLRLAGVRTVAGTAPVPAPIPKPPTLREQTLAILARENAVVPGDLDHHARLRELDALLREEDLDAARGVKRLVALRSWREVGYPFRVFNALYPMWKTLADEERFSIALKELVTRFGKFKAFEAAKAEQTAFLAEHGGTWDDVHYAFTFKGELHLYGVTPKDGLEVLRQIVAEAYRRGLDPVKAVPAFFEAYAKHGSLAAAVETTEAQLTAEQRALAETTARCTAAETKLDQMQAAHAEEGRTHEARIRALEEAIAARTDALARKDAELAAANKRVEEINAKLARPDRALVLGEALILVAEAGEGKALFDLARLVNEMLNHRVPVTVGLDLMRHFLRRVKEFVDGIDRVSDLVKQHEAEIAEKDEIIAGLRDEVKQLRERTQGEGTA
jgi:hypothetical protein